MRSMYSFFLSCGIVYLFLISTSLSQLVINADNGFQKQLEDSPSLIVERDFSISARAVAAVPFSACSTIENNITGLVAVTSTRSSLCSIRTSLQNLLDAGAAGVITMRDNPAGGLGAMAMFARSDKVNVNINGVEIAQDNDFEALVKDTSVVVMVTMTPSRNKFEAFFNGPAMVIYSVVFQVASVGCIALSAWRLKQFISIIGWQWTSVAEMCIAVEIIMNVIRMFWMIDAWWFTGIYPYGVNQGLNALSSFTPSLLITLSITFYWERTLRSVKVIPVLDKFRWPAAVLGILIFLIQIVVVALPHIGGILFTVLMVILSIVTLCIVVFYWIIGGRLLLVLAPTKTNKAYKYKRMTVMMILSGSSLFLSIIFYVLFLTPMVSTVGGNYFVFWGMFVSLYALSYFRLLAFRPPSTPGNSGSKSSPNPTKASQPTEITEMESREVKIVVEEDSSSDSESE